MVTVTVKAARDVDASLLTFHPSHQTFVFIYADFSVSAESESLLTPAVITARSVHTNLLAVMKAFW